MNLPSKDPLYHAGSSRPQKVPSVRPLLHSSIRSSAAAACRLYESLSQKCCRRRRGVCMYLSQDSVITQFSSSFIQQHGHLITSSILYEEHHPSCVHSPCRRVHVHCFELRTAVQISDGAVSRLFKQLPDYSR